MAITLPDGLTEPMSWIGLDWPQANEDLLFEAGQRWIEYGMALPPVAAQASADAGRAWASSRGDTAAAFETWWTRDDGPQRRLADDAAAALLIGGAFLAFAAATLLVKLSIITQLISLLILVGQAVATAFFTFGATTAEIPGLIAVARPGVRKLLDLVMHQVESIVRETLGHARSLLRRGSRLRVTGLSGDIRALTGDVRPGDVPAVPGDVPADLPHLTDGHRRALADYTSSGYRDLNQPLRSAEPVSPELDRQAGVLSDALAQLPPHEGTVFRGISLSDQEVAAYRPGEVLSDPGFASSTMDPRRTFVGNVRLVIDSVNGKDISAYSRIPSESEVLFDRGTSFRVQDHIYDAVHDTHHIYLTEVT